MDDDDPSNDYLILYPTFVILPDVARVPDPGSIRSHSSDEQAWNTYVAPYRRIEEIVGLGSKAFSSPTDYISRAFMFVERQGVGAYRTTTYSGYPHRSLKELLTRS